MEVKLLYLSVAHLGNLNFTKRDISVLLLDKTQIKCLKLDWVKEARFEVGALSGLLLLLKRESLGILNPDWSMEDSDESP